jgi:hypothetical protein
LLVSLPLAYVAATGFRTREGEEAAADATPYGAATFLSGAAFSWINPLISKGHASGSLAAADVPPVCAFHRAQASHELFTSNWLQQGSSSVGVALWLSFWPQLVLTAFLGLARVAAMYVGPSIIARFVDFIRRRGTAWEGLRLVLVAGKAAQTMASHHYNFQGRILGLRIRGAL